MAKYNPFDPANGYSEEDRLALNGKCASLINQAYKNPFPGTKIRLDGADNLAHLERGEREDAAARAA